ncbi:hypothetical protein N7G274_000210 [Stereocaulon virgatum]|uniref:Uncharacterized protein n=1 Tax=Stereocaulon virgatum TaxID=373712 RepID=A0ABR4ARG4_9LECA
MKRPRAELDPHPSSPTPKRSKRAVQCASYPQGQMSASRSSADSSTSTLLSSSPKLPPEDDIPSSDLDDSISDTSSSTSSISSSSLSNQNDSSSTNANSSTSSSTSSSISSSNSSSNPFYLTRAPLTDADLARQTATYEAINDFTTDSDPSSISSTSASSSTNSPLPPSSPSYLSFTTSESTASLSSPSSSSNSSSSSGASTTAPNHSLLSTENQVTLQSRLNELLPKMRSANQELEVERAEGRLGERDIENLDEEEGEEGRGYIEMNLGLGVLEERGEGSESDGSQVDKANNKDGGRDGVESAVGRLMRSRRTKGKRKVGD